jgi:hypothetical protein
MHSFDVPRERPAPRAFAGVTPEGQSVSGVFSRLTLVVAVKENCEGCRQVLESGIGDFGEVATLMVSRTAGSESWWTTSVHPIVISPELMEALEIRWPPAYVLIDPETQKVVTEGVVFGPEQVRREIAAYVM